MYKKHMISAEEADKIINCEENYFTDVKAKQIVPNKLSQTVSAFANASGGDIYIGIQETGSVKNRSWLGFSDVEEANDIIRVLSELHPLSNHIKFEFFECSSRNGLVLHITVLKTKDIIKSTDGGTYIRVNAGKIKVDTEEKLARLRLDKGIDSFENNLVDIEIRKIENSSAIIGFLLNVIPNAEPLTYLNNQELLPNANQCKVSGVLLFCDEPAVYLPKRCSIKIMRYKTGGEDISRDFLDGSPLTIEGDLYSLIYCSVEQTQKIVESIQRLGVAGFETISYPQETLHEIITNAVLHRDYSIATDIQVRVFDNRIEVESPGKLPGHVTIENILDSQCARNPMIVRLINKFENPPNKDVGEGLNTAFSAMENLRLKPPIIAEKENSVIVTIPHESLASPEELVIEYLNKNTSIRNSTGREITGIKSENTMKRVFWRLRDRGMIEHVPETNGPTYEWRLKNTDTE